MNMRNEIIEEHYRKNAKQLVNKIMNRVPNKSRALAEEVVQDAYERCLRYWKAFDPERSEFHTWFNRILRSSVSTCLQSENNNVSFDDDDNDLEPYMMWEDDSIPKNIARQIQDAIQKEPRDRAEVLHMFFNLGMKTREIEQCTDFKHNNIRLIIHRFRIKWNEENIF